MPFVADLHIHSRFSRATSRGLTLPALHASAQTKGIAVLGTGDFTHPAWRAEIAEQLEPAEPGLLKLREDLRREAESIVPLSCRQEVRFVLQVEISTIYKAMGKTRKVHHVILSPSLEGAEQLSSSLDAIGNISSDGRPILGLDSRDLLEMVLEQCPGGVLIPAHIWTPWFAVLGSKSGFDAIDDCYRDLTDHLFAVETGLSSDPPMNWRVTALDRFALVSNSDAHSPSKLGRECNLFDTDLSFDAMMNALRDKDPRRFLGTVEFFPEEGKYHLDGHRKCGARLNPQETRDLGERCPRCGRPVTVGVMHRVEDLADRTDGERPENASPFVRLLGLSETIGKVLGCGPKTKKVDAVRERLVTELGAELFVLQDAETGEIEKHAGDLVAEAIRRVRAGQVTWKAGYDGEFGTFELLSPNEREVLTGQMCFFNLETSAKETAGQPDIDSTESGSPTQGTSHNDTSHVAASGTTTSNGNTPTCHAPQSEDEESEDIGEMTAERASLPSKRQGASNTVSPFLEGLSDEQLEAVVSSAETPILVVAGPGTGKTRTLTTRIAYWIRRGELDPGDVLALTFTNRAAEEMSERLAALLCDTVDRPVSVLTFHAFGLALLRTAGVARPRVLNDTERLELVAKAIEGSGVSTSRRLTRRVAEVISLVKAGTSVHELDAQEIEAFEVIYHAYEEELEREGAFDFDDLVLKAAEAIEESEDGLPRLLESSSPLQMSHVLTKRASGVATNGSVGGSAPSFAGGLTPPSAVFVDEYQDLNATQVRLLRSLVSSNVTGSTRLFAIGDPDQAIYGFRGADPERILEFQSDWPGSRVLSLGRSYRSSDTILEAAGQVIASAPGLNRPKLWSGLEGEPHLVVLSSRTGETEADRIALLIERLLGGTSLLSFDSGLLEGHERSMSLSLGDVAVLYRIRSQGEPIAKALGRLGLPVQMSKSTAMERDETVSAVLEALRWSSGRMSTTEAQAFRARPWSQTILTLSRELRDKELGARDTVEQITRAILDDSARKGDILHPLWRRAGLIDEAWAKKVRKKASFVKPGRPLDDLLDWVALHSEVDLGDPRAERISLMTLHAAKGLEWKVVVIAGCEDGLIPYRRPEKTTDVDEERRLFFVGMTRAEQLLVLSHAAERTIYGTRTKCGPSPYLEAIETRYLKRDGGDERHREPQRQRRQMDLF